MMSSYEALARAVGWTNRPATIENGVHSDPCVVRGTTKDDPEYRNGFKYAENWQDACESDGLLVAPDHNE